MQRSTCVLAAVGVVAVLGVARLGLAQSISTVPDSAILMVKVNNVQKVSQKIGKLCEQWGIAAIKPEAADPLGFLQNRTQIKKGVNLAGEMAVIMLDPGQGPPPMIIMIPVTDYQAFLGNFPNTTADGAISNISLAPDGEPAFVMKWGSFAALALDKTLLETKLTSAPFPAQAAKQMAGRDVVAYVNFRAFRDKAVGALAFGKPFLLSQLDQQSKKAASADKRKFLPLAKVAMGQIFNGIEHVLKETQAATYGIALGDEGIQVTTVCEFEPNSYLAQTVAQVKNIQGNFAAGLPEGKYITVGGIILDSPVYAQLIDDAAAPVLIEVAKMGDEMKPIADYVAATKTAVLATKRYSFAAAGNDQKVGDGPLVKAMAVLDGDAKALLAAQKTMMQSQEQFLKLFDFQNMGVAKTEIKSGAKIVDGVSFDEMSLTMSGVPEGSPQAAMQKMMYGPDGMKMYLGEINPQTVLIAEYGDDVMLQKSVEAARTRKTTFLDANIKQVSAKLPDTRFVEMYLSVDQGAAMISKVMQSMTGQPLPVDIPAGEPPIGMSASTEGASIRTDVYVPSAVIQNIVGGVMQMEMGKMTNEKKQDGGL